MIPLLAVLSALIIGAVFAVWLLMRQQKLSFSQVGLKMAAPLETAGMIILITSAGGAFGLMLKNAGVGDAIQGLVAGRDVEVFDSFAGPNGAGVGALEDVGRYLDALHHDRPRDERGPQRLDLLGRGVAARAPGLARPLH